MLFRSEIVARDDFRRVNEAVLRHAATRGNVETELASPEAGAGCGCGYPDWVDDAEVERSNRIIERLRATAAELPDAIGALRDLPPFLVAEVAGQRVGVVHGDADSLAGWGFSQEVLSSERGRAAALASFRQANVAVFASSHTCLPVLQKFGERHAIVNNGAAGMPNFRGTRYGQATRISTRARAGAMYGARIGRLHVEAVAIAYDHAAWLKRFLASWPPESDAHASYYARIVDGPRYERAAA